MNTVLKARDPKLWNILCKEYKRQRRSLELIIVRTLLHEVLWNVLGSVFTKNTQRDKQEQDTEVANILMRGGKLVVKRALSAFNLNPKVQGM